MRVSNTQTLSPPISSLNAAIVRSPTSRAAPSGDRTISQFPVFSWQFPAEGKEKGDRSQENPGSSTADYNMGSAEGASWNAEVTKLQSDRVTK